MGDAIVPGAHDLYYLGGGQAEQLLVAADFAAKGEALRESAAAGAAVLAECAAATSSSAAATAAFTARTCRVSASCRWGTAAGERRMIGDVLIESDIGLIASFENHAGRTRLDPDAEPLGRVVSGFGNDGESGYEGCRVGRVIGTYLHGPLLPRNPRLADWVLAQALAHRGGGEPPELGPLDDELEVEAFAVSSARARARGGRR